MAFGPNTVIAFAGYACLPIAWWLHGRERSGPGLALLMLCAGLLRLSASLDPCLHPWDERYHALVAKNLIDDPIKPLLYSDPELPHVTGSWAHGHEWLNKPPLSLWSIALSLKCFGLHPWAVRLPSLLLSITAVALLYYLTRILTTRRAAFWAALLFAINGHLIELASGRTSNDHPDTFLLVFVLAALYAAARFTQSSWHGWAVVCGVLTGLAFMSKAWPALLVLPVAAAFAGGGGGRHSIGFVFITAASALLIALPWSIYTQLVFPDVNEAASHSHWQHFTEAIEGHGRPWSYYFEQLPMIHGELAPIALIWFLFIGVRERTGTRIALLAWWLIPYFIFSMAVTKMPAYTSIATPAIFIILGSAVDHAFRMEHGARWRTAALVASAGLVLLPLRFSFNRVAPLTAPEPPYSIPASLLSASSNTVVFNCPVPIEVMFHAPVAGAYEEDLADEREHLLAAGYTLVDWRTISN